MALVCCNCNQEFPPGTEIVSTRWICSGQCYLNWFEWHFGRPLRLLRSKDDGQGSQGMEVVMGVKGEGKVNVNQD